MPAVINVGGPVAWGLIVLASAWAVRAGRALAGRRRARRMEREEEALLHDPNAHQPQYLQRLSATAIRMLIETGALPCAVLELADGDPAAAANGQRGRAAAAGSNAETGASAAVAAAAARPQAQQAGAASAAAAAVVSRIVPSELAAAAPCMSVAAWVRALAGEEAWRQQLASAGGGGGGSGGTTAVRGRLAPPPAQTPQLASAGAGTDGGGGVSGPNSCRSLQQERGAEADPWVGPAAAGGRASGGSAAVNVAATLPYPPRHTLLVVLGRSERSVAAVTAAAAAAGFSRVAVWVGPAETFAAASLCGPRLPLISRHALWLVLGLGQQPLFHVPSLVLDVRRPDERLSYGAIRGTVNIPADELASALALQAVDFRRRYGVSAPGREDVVVVLSRCGRRAAWAAQVCLDVGLHRVYVYGEGVYGWRLEDSVKPYKAYDVGAPPPDPEPFSPEEPDEATGLEELHELGLAMRQGPRPARFSTSLPQQQPQPPPPPPNLLAAATPPTPPL